MISDFPHLAPRKLQSLRAQRMLVAISIGLFVLKFFAYYLTASVAILTDALESTVNVLAGLIGFYSLHLSAQPRDTNHPYGHGKAEFLSAAVEGTLVLVAGLFICYEAVRGLLHPHPVQRLDVGILLISATAVVNYLVGLYCVRTGKKNNSLALIASGTHLKTDTYTTVGLVAGLGLFYFTGVQWIDGAVALFFSGIIVRTGFLILRRSISGIMDEADDSVIAEIVQVLSAHREINWIDVHHLRAVNYAGFFHIDCHLTLPWYFTVQAAHDETDRITQLLQRHFEGAVEFSIHTDPCTPMQCPLCRQPVCPVRQHAFVRELPWTVENFRQNQKHTLPEEALRIH